MLLSAAAAGVRCGGQSKDPLKVALLGFDGANWNTIDPLLAAGKLPFLAEMKKRCAWADFETFNPAKSHIVWTSIATGKTMLKHGILDFTYLKENNLRVPYTKNELREPQLWHILEQFHKRSTVVNWYATHPPSPNMNGILVSNRFRRAAIRRADMAEKFIDSVHPTSLFSSLKPLIERDYVRALQHTGVENYLETFQTKRPNIDPQRIPVLRSFDTFLKQEATVDHISDFLFDRPDWDLFATYFRLPDLVQHFAWFLLDPDLRKEIAAAKPDAPDTAGLHRQATLEVARILEPVYRYMESILKSFIERGRSRNVLFLVMSDHGFAFHPGGYNHLNLPEGHPAPPGILLIDGPGIVPGRLSEASVFDVAPTVLHSLDLPVGANMDGRSLKEAFKSLGKIRRKAYTLQNTGSTRQGDSDREELEELKSIGYIQ